MNCELASTIACRLKIPPNVLLRKKWHQDWQVGMTRGANDWFGEFSDSRLPQAIRAQAIRAQAIRAQAIRAQAIREIRQESMWAGLFEGIEFQPSATYTSSC